MARKTAKRAPSLTAKIVDGKRSLFQPTSAPARSRWFAAAVIGIFAVAFSLITITSFVQKSVTVDEPVHLLAGYSYLNGAIFAPIPSIRRWLRWSLPCRSCCWTSKIHDQTRRLGMRFRPKVQIL